jgi:hypothetical protein
MPHEAIQTICILSAAIVFLAKQTVDAWKAVASKKNGTPGSSFTMLQDLHKWHQPVSDIKTGQPRFMWYEDKELTQEIRNLRVEQAEIKDILKKLLENFSSFFGQFNSHCKVVEESEAWSERRERKPKKE